MNSLLRKCRIFTTNNNSGYEDEGFPGDYTRHFTDMLLTDDGFVLSKELQWRTMKWKSSDDLDCIVDMNDESAYEEGRPAKIIDGQNLYTPYDGTFISRNRDNNRLKLPFEVDGKWGFCHAFSGKVVIEPQWDFCDEFDGSVARINIGGKFDPLDPLGECSGMWGMIDSDGDIVIEPSYQYISRSGFSSDRLAKRSGLWGIIDDYGEVLVAIEWDGIWFDFDNKLEDKYKSLQYGYIVMKNTDGHKRYSAINHDGRIMVEDIPDFTPPEFPKQYVFHDEEEDEDGSDYEDWD